MLENPKKNGLILSAFSAESANSADAQNCNKIFCDYILKILTILAGCRITVVRDLLPAKNFSGCSITVVRTLGVGMAGVQFPAPRPD